MLDRNTHPKEIDAFLALFNGDSTSAIQAIQEYSDQTKRRSYDFVKKGSDTIISISTLSKTYKIGKQQTDVLDNISLNINRGEFIAITGASGSGKSTLLQLIGGLDHPTSGSVVVNGVDINHLNDAERSAFRNQTIGFIFQFFYLQPFLKIAKNIEVPGMFARIPRRERRVRAQKLIEQVKLQDQQSHLPKQLSGGQIQRTAIARALLNNPKIILADEPTGNLDSTNSQLIIDLLKEVRKDSGATIVLVTHNPDIAAQADREIRLVDGAIV